MQKFFVAHPRPGAERVLAETLEQIETLVIWKAHSKPELGRLLGKS